MSVINSKTHVVSYTVLQKNVLNHTLLSAYIPSISNRTPLYTAYIADFVFLFTIPLAKGDKFNGSSIMRTLRHISGTRFNARKAPAALPDQDHPPSEVNASASKAKRQT